MKLSPLVFCTLTLLSVPSPATEEAPSTLDTGRFGKVTIYPGPKDAPAQLVLFLSGDGGWNEGVVDMAKALVPLGATVIGINTPQYLKNLDKSTESCHYPAADLESLSHLIQQKRAFPSYVKPLIVGYSSGATLAYLTIAQSPTNTFSGAVSLGFCSDIQMHRPPCKGSHLTFSKLPRDKGFDLKPASALETPWVALHGNIDKDCFLANTKAFLKKIPSAQLVELNNVGHGFSIQKKWMPQFIEVYSKLKPVPEKALADSEVSDLPLIEITAPKNDKDALVVIISGDGGWASLDKDLGTAMQNAGYHVVGLDSLRYFWKAKTPEILGKDLTRIAKHYLKQWNKQHIIWIGYSMGADALSFGLSRLPADLKSKTLGAAYLGLSQQAEFEFHLTNWLSEGSSGTDHPTIPEIAKLKSFTNICVRGTDEKESGCDQLGGHATILKLPGGHHFGGAYDKIAELILEQISKQ